MGGHPLKTWLYTPPPPPQPSKIPRRARSFRSRDAKVLVKQPSTLLRRTPSAKAKAKSASNLLPSGEAALPADPKSSAPELSLEQGQQAEVYWPLDLLPQSCPSTRILTWGCNAISLGGRMPRAQSDVFGHADDLLAELTLLRDETDTAERPVIFIVHSLGGIILKEVGVSRLHTPCLLIPPAQAPSLSGKGNGPLNKDQVLRRSEAEYDHPCRSLLPSTSAAIFLACPHRATEHGSLAAAVRSMAGECLGVSPMDYTLQLLTGSRGLEVEAGREAFERMWNDWNFGVRCFAEGKGDNKEDLVSLNTEGSSKGGLGVWRKGWDQGNSGLRAQELRKAAASIGDPRGRAEVFDANHLDICKFRSSQDPNFKAVLSSLTYYILKETHRKRKLNQKEKGKHSHPRASFSPLTRRSTLEH